MYENNDSNIEKRCVSEPCAQRTPQDLHTRTHKRLAKLACQLSWAGAPHAVHEAILLYCTIRVFQCRLHIITMMQSSCPYGGIHWISLMNSTRQGNGSSSWTVREKSGGPGITVKRKEKKQNTKSSTLFVYRNDARDG